MANFKLVHRASLAAAVFLLACSSSDQNEQTDPQDEIDGPQTGQSSSGLLILGSPTSLQLQLTPTSNSIAISQIVVSGKALLSAPSPLFELAVGDCVWNSLAAGSHGEKKTISTIQSSGISITARLNGCTSGLNDLVLSMSLSDAVNGKITMTSSLRYETTRAGLPSGSVDGWFGPFSLGDVPLGGLPVFGADANLTAVRSRANLPYQCDPGNTCPQLEPQGLREEAFVVGFDGIIYGSRENDNGPWTIPTAIVDTGNPSNRDFLVPGGALASLRRNDAQTDLFAIPKNGIFTSFARVGFADTARWGGPIALGGGNGQLPTFLPGAPIAVLSLHEESSTAVNEVEAYVAGFDGRVWATHESNNGAWSVPAPLPGAPQSGSCALPFNGTPPIAALKRNHRQRDLFYIDRLGQLCTAFRFRVNDGPPDDFGASWRFVPISPPGMFAQSGSVAAAHGPGNSEYVFAIGVQDGSVHPFVETNDGAWRAQIPLAVGNITPTSSLSAARRTARDVELAVATTNSAVVVFRAENGSWLASTLAPTPGASAPNRKIVLNLRNADQLDVFGVGGNGDNRLWTSADSLGRLEVRMVLPKLIFGHGDVAGERGMVPMEMAGSRTLANGCLGAEGCVLGMPLVNQPIAGGNGVPEAFNMMELAHVTKSGSSFFVADVSPSEETGHSPAQINLDGDSLVGFWTKNMWPGRSSDLPTIQFGGYAGTDWHPAVAAYVAAHANNPPPPATPSWLRDAGAIYTFGHGGAGAILLDGTGTTLAPYARSVGATNFTQIVNKMSDEAAGVGTNVLYLWDYWGADGTCPGAAPNDPNSYYFCKGDYRIRNDFGGLLGLQQAISQLHQTQGRIILYVEPFLWGFGPDIMNQFGDLFSARLQGQGGAPWYAFGTGGGGGVVLSYAHSGWIDQLVQTCVRLIQSTGADGIFLDSAGWRANERPETKDEIVRASPLEHMQAYLEMLDRVRAGIRQVRPDAVVLGENMGGPGSRHIDGALSSDLGKIFHIRDVFSEGIVANPTRAGRKSANIFSNGHNLGELNQVIAAGHNLVLENDRSSAPPDDFIFSNAPYIQRLVQARRSAANALVEGDEAELTTGNTTVIGRSYLGADGSKAVTLVNLSAQGQTVNVGGIPSASGAFVMCDVVSRTTFTVSATGTLANVSIPPAPSSCTVGQVCGLRLLVSGTCN